MEPGEILDCHELEPQQLYNMPYRYSYKEICHQPVRPQYDKEKSMNTSTKRVLFWAPRVLSILFVLFISVFALDVFSEGYGFWEAILALLIHLIPTFILIIALVFAWRWEWVGALLFTAVALFFLISSGGESWVISGPLFVIGTLFLLNWIYRDKLETS